MLTLTDTPYSVVLYTEGGSVVVEPTPDASLRLALVDSLAGPPGPQGPAGPSGDGIIAQRIAGAALGGHRVVRSLPDGRVGYASASDDTHGDDTVGMTLQAVADGGVVDVLSSGSVEHSGWAWVQGAPVFVGEAGTPTQLLDGTAAFMQIIGHAETETTLFLSLQPPIYL